MNKHLFKLLFGTLFLVAATAFTGCSDDDENKSGAPTLKAIPETVNITVDTGLTLTVNVEANCEWEIVKSGLDWATITPMSGKGDTKITITAEELASGSREGKFSFTLKHPEYGKWATGESPVTVKQFADGILPPPDKEIYSNNFDKEPATQTGTKWPDASSFEGFKNQIGDGAASVAYAATAMTVRANSVSNDSHSKYEGSGTNNMFFGSGASFEIQKIALTSAQSKLRLTFGSYRSVFEATDNGFVTSEFHIFLSKDGDAWTEITYERPVGEDEHTKYGTWALATADFTLKEVPAELYIKFSSDLASVHRIDDVKLVEGIGGQEVVFGVAPDPTSAKIGEITKAGAYKTEGTVVAQGKMAYIIADNTGAMMVYHKDNERKVGDKIAIDGEVTIFNAASTPQFSEKATVSVISTGNSWTYKPEVLAAADLDALLTATPACKEVQFEGTLAIDGNYANVTIDGATTAIGSVKYIDNTTIADLNEKVVIIKGYFVGTSSSKFINVLPYSVEAAAPSTDPKITAVAPTALTFAATDVAKKVTVTARNADGCTLDASADKAQFSVAVNGMEVTVTPQENATDAAITATLTIKLMKAGAAVDTKTVAVTQNKKNSDPSGDDTKGIYTSMDILTCTKDLSDDAYYTLSTKDGDSKFNGEVASGVKLGTGSKAGFFTSQPVGVSGAKKLSFYAVAWKAKSATVYVRVNNGGTVASNSVAVAANDGATGNPPFLAVTVTDSDYYTFELSDLTPESTITISTSPTFAADADKNTGRAVVAGIQLY